MRTLLMVLIIAEMMSTVGVYAAGFRSTRHQGDSRFERRNG